MAAAAAAAAGGGDATVPKSIRARVGAARVILEQNEGKASHPAISRVQASALADLLTHQELSPAARAAIAEAVCMMKWHDGDSFALLEILAPPAPRPKGKKSRRDQQDYMSILGYFTDSIWKILLSPEESSTTKLALLIDFSISLGLRCPSEHSIHLLNSIWVVMSETSASLQRMSADAKHTLLLHTKRVFDQARLRASPPIAYIENLPAKPILLLQQQPNLFKTCYKEDSPIDPSIDLTTIFEFDMSYKCRGGGTSAQQTKQLVQQEPVVASPIAGGNMLQFASMFMDRVEALQLGQQRMLEAFVGQPGEGGVRVRGLRAMGNL